MENDVYLSMSHPYTLVILKFWNGINASVGLPLRLQWQLWSKVLRRLWHHLKRSSFERRFTLWHISSEFLENTYARQSANLCRVLCRKTKFSLRYKVPNKVLWLAGCGLDRRQVKQICDSIPSLIQWSRKKQRLAATIQVWSSMLFLVRKLMGGLRKAFRFSRLLCRFTFLNSKAKPVESRFPMRSLQSNDNNAASE